MDIRPTTPTAEQTTIEPPHTSVATDEVVESVKTCPSCNFTDDSEFLTCPSCGLILQKYFKLKSQRTDAASLSKSREVDTDAALCPATPKSPKKASLVVCSVIIVFLGVMFYKMNTPPTLSEPSTNVTSQKTGQSSPSAPAKPQDIADAPVINQPTGTVSAGSTNPSVNIPQTLPNSLGITMKKIVFASDIDAANMPVDNLTRVPFNGKKIVVRVKMEIPPEKNYQFTGKFFDGDGKLVMNVTSPSTPTLSVWYAWYYHNLDRADDKPGVWKFVFLVNGEQVLEEPIEVVDQ